MTPRGAFLRSKSALNTTGFAQNQVSLIDQPQLLFAGTPGQANCYDQSIATLAGLYGGIALDGAAAALGFSYPSGKGRLAERLGV
jgi:hypothetical protein